MPPKEKVEFAGTLSAAEAAQYLESLAKGMREHTMLVESGDASLTLQVPADVKVEIEVAADADKGKTDVEISISWRQPREEEAAPPAGLLIVPGTAPGEPATYTE